MFLIDVVKCLDNAKIKYALVGGYALALQGIVRATVDVDLVIQINKSQLNAIEKAMASIGLTSRIPVNADQIYEFREEYIKNKNLIAWSFVDYKDPMRVVDVLLTETLKSFTVEKVSAFGQKISVVSLKDLLKMKEKSNRPKDQLDVESIKASLKNEK